MLYLDVTSSCKSPMNTGVQRVVRGLFRSLSEALGPAEVIPVLWEPRLTSYCTLSSRELGFLEDPFAGHVGRRARAEPGRVANRVPFLSKGWRQVVHRRNRTDLARTMTGADTLFVPEIFQDGRVAWLSGLAQRSSARRVAVCHDAIGWRQPELTLTARLDGFIAYLASLRTFDGVLAVSREASGDLHALWRAYASGELAPDLSRDGGDRGNGNGRVKVMTTATTTLPTPPVRVAGWPADEYFTNPVTRWDLPPAPAVALPQVLCVGTFEPRKNHLTLLAAAEQVWAGGARFELVLAGRTTAGWGEQVEGEIERLRRNGRHVHWRRHVDDETLRALYRRCRFTVFPSLVEGFGLPVIESLRHGRPCVCGGNGALGELAADGGCFVVADQSDSCDLADALRRLLTDDGLHARLGAEARARCFPTWRDYVREVSPFLLATHEEAANRDAVRVKDGGDEERRPSSEFDFHPSRELRAEA